MKIQMANEIAGLKNQIYACNDKLFETLLAEERQVIIMQRTKLLRKVNQLAKAQLSTIAKAGKVSREFAEHAKLNGLIFLT